MRNLGDVMGRDSIDLYEAVELFVIDTVQTIKSGCEIPNINFVFDKESQKLINKVYRNPVTIDGFWTPSITESDLERLKIENNQDEKAPTIMIHDGFMFFCLLVLITNKNAELCQIYGKTFEIRNLFMKATKNIFLRMTKEDFDNVEEFLLRQYDFSKDHTFDYLKDGSLVANHFGYEILAKTSLNSPWDETDRRMSFSAYQKEKLVHELSHVNYGIRMEDGEPVCYVYAVQNSINRKRDKRFERILYKLKSSYGDIPVHPNQVFTLMLFYGELKKKGIKKIVVPTHLELDYDYHIILGRKIKENFESRYTEEALSSKDTWSELKKEEYDYYRTVYGNVVGKSDLICRIKREKLIHLFEALQKCTDGLVEQKLENSVILSLN